MSLSKFRETSTVSARAAGTKKDLAALTWVYRWGWSSAGVVDASCSQRRGIAARLVRRGLLKSEVCDGAIGRKGMPEAVLTLTNDGVTEVEADLENLNPYSAKIPWHQLRHDMTVQTNTLAFLQRGLIKDYITPRESHTNKEFGVKIPDVIFIMNDNSKSGIELELTAKHERDLHTAVESIIKQLRADKISRFIILSHSQAILKRYKDLIQAGNKVKQYQKDQSGRWKHSSDLVLGDGWQQQILFQKIEL
jgi:hypothetical protein